MAIKIRNKFQLYESTEAELIASKIIFKTTDEIWTTDTNKRYIGDGVNEITGLTPIEGGGGGGGDASTLNGQAGTYYLNRANHTGSQESSTISNFQSSVSANTDVSANTAQRHTHSNKAILDGTTASFLTTDRDKIGGIESGATVGADWNENLSNIPASFTPSAHTHNASDINAGTLADARIPSLSISKTTGLQAALDGKVGSVQEGGVGTIITNIIQVTQAEYDGLTPQAGTFYAIVG